MWPRDHEAYMSFKNWLIYTAKQFIKMKDDLPYYLEPMFNLNAVCIMLIVKNNTDTRVGQH